MQQLLSSQGIAPVHDEHARAAVVSNEQTLERLRTLNGAAFDRAYMDSQVALHRWTLESLDRTLIPGARNEPLEDFLEQLRPRVQAHLEQAQEIRAGLGS